MKTHLQNEIIVFWKFWSSESHVSLLLQILASHHGSNPNILSLTFSPFPVTLLPMNPSQSAIVCTSLSLSLKKKTSKFCFWKSLCWGGVALRCGHVRAAFSSHLHTLSWDSSLRQLWKLEIWAITLEVAETSKPEVSLCWIIMLDGSWLFSFRLKINCQENRIKTGFF